MSSLWTSLAQVAPALVVANKQTVQVNANAARYKTKFTSQEMRLPNNVSQKK